MTSNQTPPAVVGTLDDLLESERAALLKGDVDRINRLVDRKEALISQVSALTDVPASVLATLQEKLRRNHELIEHALAGIRAAAKRVEDMRKARETLQTYDRRGRLQDLSTAAKRAVEKRA